MVVVALGAVGFIWCRQMSCQPDGCSLAVALWRSSTHRRAIVESTANLLEAWPTDWMCIILHNQTRSDLKPPSRQNRACSTAMSRISIPLPFLSSKSEDFSGCCMSHPDTHWWNCFGIFIDAMFLKRWAQGPHSKQQITISGESSTEQQLRLVPVSRVTLSHPKGTQLDRTAL